MTNPPLVFIAGAGPVGLSAAIGLATLGVPVRIIDPLPQRMNQSRAAIIHARTLEHFQRLGIVDRFLERGVRVHGARILGPGGKVLIHPTLDHLDTPFPFMLGLEQCETERLLGERLEELGVHVERGWKLDRFSKEATGVHAMIRDSNGRESVVACNYLLGCDGGHSAVRTGLGLHLEGETLDAVWITVDVKIDWDRDPGEAVAALSPEGIVFIAAMNDDRWRVILNLHAMTKDEAEKLTVDDVQKLARERFELDMPMRDCVWISTFGINTRMAPTMKSGSIFLAGDAAHVHSPVGGQGMNTGIQDALNLVWKLALVVEGSAGEGLLESYNTERHANAKRLLAFVGPATRMVNIRHPVAIEVRNHLIHLIGELGIAHLFARRVGMLDVGYPDSPIVGEPHHGLCMRGPRAGERAPDAHGLAAVGVTSPASLFEAWANDFSHQLLLFGDAPDATDLPDWIRPLRVVKSGEPVSRVLVDAEGEAFQAYGVSGSAMYLVRPDGIVAYRNTQPGRNDLKGFLREHYSK